MSTRCLRAGDSSINLCLSQVTLLSNSDRVKQGERERERVKGNGEIERTREEMYLKIEKDSEEEGLRNRDNEREKSG